MELHPASLFLAVSGGLRWPPAKLS